MEPEGGRRVESSETDFFLLYIEGGQENCSAYTGFMFLLFSHSLARMRQMPSFHLGATKASDLHLALSSEHHG